MSNNIEQLEKLADLKSRGVISEDEYQKEKKKILDNNIQPKKKGGCLKFIGISFIILIVLGVIGSMLEKKDSTGSPSSQSNSSPVTEKPVLKFSVLELEEMYDQNEVKTDEEIKGHDIQVTGKVASIDKDFTDAIVIQLQGSNQYMPASMTMYNSEKSTAMNLKKGQSVIVQCSSMKYVVKSPTGYDCTFISVGN